MRKGIENQMWVLIGIFLALFAIALSAPLIDMISGSESALSGCTNLHNVIADAVDVELC